MCELIKAREKHNETLKIQSLREVKNAISQEATRFSGHQQHVNIIFFVLFIFLIVFSQFYRNHTEYFGFIFIFDILSA